MATTKVTSKSNKVTVNVNGEPTTKVTASSNRISVGVKTTKVDVSLARVGPQGASSIINNLNDVNDVNVSNATTGQGIILDSENNWRPHTFSTSSLSDIDNTNKTNGSILIYNESNSKYEAKNEISENMIVNGGSF